MQKRLLYGVIITALAACMAVPAWADDFHYTNLLIGDRASGMGGAYIAVSDDATGLYYNPAGVAYTSGRSLSASVNAYYDTVKTYKSVIGGNGWVRHSSSLLPNYFGVVQPFGNLKVGFSYAVPESVMEDQSQTFSGLNLSPSIQPYNPPGTTITSYIINFNNENNVYNLGPSVAMELNDKFSAGLTLYYYQKRVIQILNQEIKTNSGGIEWTNGYFHRNEWGFRPVLGFMWSPADSVSVGLAVSKIFVEGSRVTSQTSYIRQNIGVDSNPSDMSLTALPDAPADSSEKPKYPTQIGLGLAWFPSQSLLLTGDINYYTSSTVLGQDLQAVTNLALGTEYYLDRNWAVRGGLYTNRANTPEVSAGGIGQPEHIDIYGGTLSLSHFTRNSSVTLGTGMNYGTGKTQIITGSTSIQDAVSQGYMVFLSSSYSY